VYLYAQNGEYIYIGKSINIRTRVKSHYEAAALEAKERAIVENADIIEYITTNTEFDALVLEANLIQEYKPKYNAIWRDDKSFLYIKIPIKDEYPKISLVRKRGDTETEDAVYFGPFGNGKLAKDLLRLLRKIVPYCTQNRLTKTKCFYAKINLCNPCPNVIEQTLDPIIKRELKRQYKQNIKQIIKILNGGIGDITKEIKSEMDILTKEENYEEALLLRNKLQAIETLFSYRFITYGNERDSLSLNEKEKDVNDLLNILRPFYKDLSSLERMECYDASHLGGQDATVSMVVMVNGQIDKGEYKKFKIKGEGDSDFARLSEAFMRRLKHTEWGWPNLFIVDGGAPQVKTIKKVFEELQITTPIVGIAKHPDRLVMNNEFTTTVRINLNNRGFNLIRLLRDEAHRFSKAYSSVLRQKRTL
jgi:excinuclease ABC subunit C